MYNGFVKISTASPLVKVADATNNARQILNLIKKSEQKGSQIISFPELSITGYTCGNIFFNQELLSKAEEALRFLLSETKGMEITVILGIPIKVSDRLLNCAVVFQKGVILGVVSKNRLVNSMTDISCSFSNISEEYLEITIAGQSTLLSENIIFQCDKFKFSVFIGEELFSIYQPSLEDALNGSNIVFNLSAANQVVGQSNYINKFLSYHTKRCNLGYVYSSPGFGESSTNKLYASNLLIFENGKKLVESEKFTTQNQLITTEIDVDILQQDRMKMSNVWQQSNYIYESRYLKIPFDIGEDKPFDLIRKIRKNPFIPVIDEDERYNSIFESQVNSLAIRLYNTGIKKAVLGISGGLDSTLALLVTVKAFDKLNLPRTDILGITMPGFGTTSRTKNNSIDLMESLKVSSREIIIEQSVLQHFKDIMHNPDIYDSTYENAQARERTQILMDIANKGNALVVGTGDMSELALGWCTYNGDHMSMYSVNAGLPKTIIQELVRWIANNKVEKGVAKILLDILNTPISPELLPHNQNKISQKTEDLIGPYELHDFFMYYFVRFGFSPNKIFFLAQVAFKDIYDKQTIEKWLKLFVKRFFTQQFKRSCMPDGVQIGSVGLSPKGEWNMPSDAHSADFMI